MKKLLCGFLTIALAATGTAMGSVPFLRTVDTPRRNTSQNRPLMTRAPKKDLKSSKDDFAKAKAFTTKSPFSNRNTKVKVSAPNHVKTAIPAESGIDNLTGYVLYASNWEDGNSLNGLYEISTNPELIAKLEGGYGMYEDDKTGILYTVQCENVLGFFTTATYWAYNAETFEVIECISENTSIGMMATDIAVNPVDGLVYGCFYNDDQDGFVWGTADYPNWTRNAISDCPEQMIGVAIDRNGNGFTVSKTGILYSVDIKTGDFLEVGNTGLAPQYLSSAAIDGISGKMYFSYCPDDNTGWLYEIDTKTAKATPVWQFANDEEIMNLTFPVISCDDKAPAAPSVKITTDKGNLTAKWTITAPTTLFDGATASGEVKYTLDVNGKTIDEGTMNYGESITGEYTADTSGIYRFGAKLTGTDKLEGPATRTSVYIGFGTPCSPEKVSISYDMTRPEKC